jgi:riboflavin biosynthesis pyrimidine reductase
MAINPHSTKPKRKRIQNMSRENRPKVVFHMLISGNGKISGQFWRYYKTRFVDEEIKRANISYNPSAWACGSVTTEQVFTQFHKPILNENARAVPEGDFVAENNAPRYYVSIDAEGKVGWEKNSLRYANRQKAHIIEVLTLEASNDYKAYLRSVNVSYIIAGDEQLDFKIACEKLFSLFNIRKLIVSGGVNINGAFLNSGIIDELSLLIAPVVDKATNGPSLFEFGRVLPDIKLAEFDLRNIEKLEGGGVWLQYTMSKRHQ